MTVSSIACKLYLKAPPGTNLVANPGFETAGGGGLDVFGSWHEVDIPVDTALAHSGTHAVQLSLTASVHQHITVVAGTPHTLTFWTAGDAIYHGYYSVYDVTNAAYIIPLTSTAVITSTYNQITEEFVTPAGCVELIVAFFASGMPASITRFDDVVLVDEVAGPWVDKSADVLSDIGVQWSRGMQGTRLTDVLAGTGICTFTLDNSASQVAGVTRLQGQYSPNHANCLTGFGIGCPVKVTLNVDAAGETTEFIGRISSIRPSSGVYRGEIVEVEAHDWMGYLASQQLGIQTLGMNQTIDQAITTVLPNFPTQPEATSFGVGEETFLTLFDTEDSQTSMASFFSKLARCEFGRIYLTGAGTLTVENRNVRPTWGRTNLLTNGDFETAGGGGADVFGTWTEVAAGGAIADDLVELHGGAHSARITAAAPYYDTYIVQNAAAVTPGSTYQLTFWTRGDGVTAGRYGVRNVTGAAWILNNISTGVPGATWTQVSVNFTAPAGCVTVSITLLAGANAATAYFDDVEVRKTSAFTLDGTMTDLDVSYNVGDLANVVIVRTFPARIDTVAVRIWDLANAGCPRIGPGETFTMTCPYRDPAGGGKVSATSVTDPVTAVEFGSRPNYSDNDLAAFLVQTNEVGSNQMIAHLKNTGSKTGYLNDFQVYGLGIYHYSPIETEVRDDFSIGSGSGEQRVVFNLEQISDPVTGAIFAAFIKAILSRQHIEGVTVMFRANQDTTLAPPATAAEISQRFTLTEALTGISQDFFINKLDYEYRDNQLDVTLLAVPASRTDCWIWDDSTWDNTDAEGWTL